MPDQFGNPTPQEVLAGIVADNDAMVAAAQTPYERRNANLFALGRTLSAGMDPRLLKAKEIQGAIGKSMALTRDEAESALDYEIRRGRQMFEDLKGVDPTTAAEISSKLVELEAERAEQLRLKAEDQRVETRFGWETEDRAQTLAENKQWDLTEGLFYEVDPRTGKTTGLTTSVKDTAHQLDVNGVRERGNILLTADDLAAAKINSSEADYKLLGSDLAATKNQITGTIENVNVAKGLMQVFLDAGEVGENPTTYFDTVARKLQPIVNAVSEGQKAIGGRPAPAVGSPEFAEDVSIFEAELQRRGLQSQVPTSLMVQLAYTWAKSFDARVTETDFLNAYQMLGAGTGSPATIAATVREMTFGRHESMMDTTGTLVNDLLRFNEDKESLGFKQGQAMQSLLGVYNTRLNEFRALSDELLKRYGAKDRHSPGAGAPAPANQLRTRTGRNFSFRDGGQ